MAPSNKDICKTYAALFNTEFGQIVLKDMQEIWRSAPSNVDPQALAHLEGQRHFMRYIESKIKQGEKE